MSHLIPTDTVSTPARPVDEVDTATLELLAKWRMQDATENPEELREAEKELAEFKKDMNEGRDRAGEPIIYP